MYSNVLRFNGKNYRVKIAKKYATNGSFRSLVLKQHHVFVNSFRFITSAFCPTSIWIVSLIKMKVFRYLLDQVSSKTVDVSFVMIKLMWRTVQLGCRTANYSCWFRVLATIPLHALCFFSLQIMDSSKRARIESGSTSHKPERTKPDNGIYNTQHSQHTWA